MFAFDCSRYTYIYPYFQLVIDFSVDRAGLDIELEKCDEIPSIG